MKLWRGDVYLSLMNRAVFDCCMVTNVPVAFVVLRKSDVNGNVEGYRW